MSNFQVDDLVRIVRKSGTSRRGHFSMQMNAWIGKTVIVTKAHPSGWLNFEKCGWTFHESDCDLVKKAVHPDWYTTIQDMIVSGACSHRLQYKCYNSSKVSKETIEGWTKRSYRRDGYCFQSFSSSYGTIYHYDRLRWNFNHKSTMIDSYGNTVEKMELPKVTIKWWFKKWMEYGAFPKDVTMTDLMRGYLDIPMFKENAKGSRKKVPSNEVYLPVSLCRHITEYADLVKGCRYLVEKEGFHFLTALSLMSLLPRVNRAHSLFGVYLVSAQNKHSSLARRVADQARMLQLYFDRREDDENLTIFNWWGTVRRIATGYNGKAANTVQWIKEIEKINEEVKELEDIKNYNPNE
jgi:hypothetical protein